MCLLSVSVVILPALSQSCAEDLLLPPNGAVSGEHGAVNAAPLNTSPPPSVYCVHTVHDTSDNPGNNISPLDVSIMPLHYIACSGSLMVRTEHIKKGGAGVGAAGIISTAVRSILSPEKQSPPKNHSSYRRLHSLSCGPGWTGRPNLTSHPNLLSYWSD